MVRPHARTQWDFSVDFWQNLRKRWESCVVYKVQAKFNHRSGTVSFGKKIRGTLLLSRGFFLPSETKSLKIMSTQRRWILMVYPPVGLQIYAKCSGDEKIWTTIPDIIAVPLKRCAGSFFLPLRRYFMWHRFSGIFRFFDYINRQALRGNHVTISSYGL